MNHSAVTHRWAHSYTNPSAHAKGSRLRSAGPALFSYSTQIAHAFPARRGFQPLAVFSSERHSLSTGRHLFQARTAWHGNGVSVTAPIAARGGCLPTERGGNIARTRLDTWKRWFVSEYRTAVKAYSTAERNGRGKETEAMRQHARRANTLARDAATFFPFFGRKSPLAATAALDPETLAKILAAADRAEKREAARLRREEKERARMQAEQICAWQNNEPNATCPHWHDTVYLRLTANAHNGRVRPVVETSKGANVPLRAALRLFAMCEHHRKTATARERWGAGKGEVVRVGGYPLRRIDKDGNVQVGCHWLTWDEMARCAATIPNGAVDACVYPPEGYTLAHALQGSGCAYWKDNVSMSALLNVLNDTIAVEGGDVR